MLQVMRWVKLGGGWGCEFVVGKNQGSALLKYAERHGQIAINKDCRLIVRLSGITYNTYYGGRYCKCLKPTQCRALAQPQ